MEKLIFTSILGLSVSVFAQTASTQASTTTPPNALKANKEFTHNCMVNSLKISTLPEASKVAAVEVDLKECMLDQAPANTYTTAKAYIQERTPFRDSMLINLTDAMKANKRVELNIQNVTLNGGMRIPSVIGMNITK